MEKKKKKKKILRIMWVNKLQEVTPQKKTFIAPKVHIERNA
jgi:hypothetical protein